MSEHAQHSHTPATDRADAAMDATLRAAAPSLDLPESAPLALPAAHRRLRPRWLAVGSGLAAAVAIGAVLFTQTRGSQVQAGAIMQSLRRAAIGGLNVTLTDLRSDGIHLNGQVRVRFDRPLTIEDLEADDDRLNVDFGAMHSAFTIRTDADAQFPNLDVRIEGAATPDNAWVFIQPNEQALQAAASENPQMAAVLGLARHGLLVDLGSPQTWAQMSVNHHDGQGFMTFSLGAGDHPAGDADADGEGPDDAANSPDEQRLDRVETLVRGLVTGHASQQDLGELKQIIDDASGRAVVQNLGGGRYLLTSDLPPEDAPPGSTSGVLRVSYVQNQGVEWAEIEVLGDAGGTIRLEPADDAIDPAIMDKQRLIVPGQTGFINLGAIMQFFGGPHQ